MNRAALLQGILWGFLFAAAVLAVVGGVMLYQASAWEGHLAAVRDLPVEATRIVSDKAFQAGYRDRAGRLKGQAQPPPEVTTLRDWINGIARRHHSFQQASLEVDELSGGHDALAAGKTELRAVFRLEGLSTPEIERLVFDIEAKHPDLVCKELSLKPGKDPYHYDLPRIVFSVLVPKL